jgi:hypothetical protein
LKNIEIAGIRCSLLGEQPEDHSSREGGFGVIAQVLVLHAVMDPALEVTLLVVQRLGARQFVQRIVQMQGAR